MTGIGAVVVYLFVEDLGDYTLEVEVTIALGCCRSVQYSCRKLLDFEVVLAVAAIVGSLNSASDLN